LVLHGAEIIKISEDLQVVILGHTTIVTD